MSVIYELNIARDVIVQAQNKLVTAQEYMSKGLAYTNTQNRAAKCLASLYRLNEELLIQIRDTIESEEEE